MAYSDYGAFVWLNGERRTDKELENLDSVGLLNMDMVGVFYQKITITSADGESKGDK